MAAKNGNRGKKIKTIEMDRLTVDEFKEAEKLPLIVMLDDVRSLYNVGAVFRSADAFRIEAIYLCGITACPPDAEIHKTALGAEDAVTWRYFERAEDAVKALQENNYYCYAVEQVHGSVMLQDVGEDMINAGMEGFDIDGYAVVFGNEVKGVKQSVVNLCDAYLEIPQWGTKHSLNVSTAAGIVMWQMTQVLREL